MMCEICGIREATIKLTQVVNQKKKEMSICKECAEEKGFANPFSGFPKIIGGLILGIMGELPESMKRERLDIKCDYCQLTWDDFQDKNLLGCGRCYESFAEPLKKMLRKMHGSNKHIGDRPTDKRKVGTIEELKKLKNELKSTIKTENYERAAELRDLIRDIEANFDTDS